MATLGDGTKITTVSTQKVVLTADNGQNFTMEMNDFVEVVRQALPIATRDKNGLLPDYMAGTTYRGMADIPAGGEFTIKKGYSIGIAAHVTSGSIAVFVHSVGTIHFLYEKGGFFNAVKDTPSKFNIYASAEYSVTIQNCRSDLSTIRVSLLTANL